jgi:TonB family protein
MKKSILFSILFLFSSFSYCQKDNSAKNYKQGIKAIDSKKYEEAISFLTLSIEELPSADAFEKRAEAYYIIGDSCAFCNDLEKAADLNSFDAYKKFNEKCRYTVAHNSIPDSILERHPYVVDIEIIHNKCNSDSIINAVSKDGDENWTDPVSKIEDVPVYTLVEKMPEYIGGDYARNKFMAEEIMYPQKATENGIQGTVYISFIIEKDGAVSNVKVLRGIGGGCDEESMRVVKLLNKWKPGSQNGKNVRVIFNMPIYFKLQGKAVHK